MSSENPHRCVLIAHPSADLYGSDRVMLESIDALIGDGSSVVVTLPGTGPLVELIEQRGARVAICPSPVLRKSALRPRGFVQLLAASLRSAVASRSLFGSAKPAVVYVSTVTVPLWILLARLRRVPVVCHVHEAEGSASRTMQRLLALPLLFTNRIIANSEFSKRVLVGSFPNLAARTEVVYNGVPGPATVTPARESLTDTVRLVYLGRLSPRKGVDVAVDAAKLLIDRGVDVSLELVGAVFPGYEWYEEQLREQIVKLGLDDRVTLAGFQPSVWARVAASDIVLVPSRVDEPFGNTAVEAVLAGRPVVASATTGLLEATAGYRIARSVKPGDPAAIADAVAELVANWNVVRTEIPADVATAADRHGAPRYHAAITGVTDALCVAR